MGKATGYSKQKTELVLTFIDALDPGWIKVFVPKSGEAVGFLQAGHGADIEADHPYLMMVETLWFARQSHAELVFEQCMATLGVDQETAIAIRASEIRDCVLNVSGLLGAAWQSTQEVVAAAEKEVEGIERHLEALKVSGGLKTLNSGYKAYRLAMQGTGEGAINYSAYLHGFKLRMVALIGRNIAAGAGKYDGVLTTIASFDNGLRDAKLSQSGLKNVAHVPVDKLHHAPLHHTRNRVHHSRKLVV